VVCEVVEGGTVNDHKGLSLPGMSVSVPALSAKDIADLEFALRLRVDLIALSFVRSPPISTWCTAQWTTYLVADCR
jgi:pyruvate kinase